MSTSWSLMPQRFTDVQDIVVRLLNVHQFSKDSLKIKINISIANYCVSVKCSSTQKDFRSHVKISSTYCVFVILCMKRVKCYISTMCVENTKLHSVYLYIYLRICLWIKAFAHPLYFNSCNNETSKPLVPIFQFK